MSLIDSAVPNRGHHISGNLHLMTLLPLNDLFKDSMRRAQARWGLRDVVVRCEPLPTVRGHKESLTQVFDVLVNSIFSALPTGSKFFLYVNCEADRSAGDHSYRQEEWKPYILRFHTNITTDEQWKNANQQLLAQCAEILSTHHAIFVVNNINNTGCLFSITVPGKLQ